MRLGVREEVLIGREGRCVTLLALEEITETKYFARWLRRFCKRYGKSRYIGTRITFEPANRRSQTSWEIVDLDVEE